MHRYIKLTSSLGDITLVKPSKWSLGTYRVLTNKIKSPDDEFIKHVIYCSQTKDDQIYKYSLVLINKLDLTECKSLFLTLVNSDEILLQKCNACHLTKNAMEACNLLKSYIEDIATNLVVHFLAMMLHVSITDSWISALTGNLEDRHEKLADLSSIFRKVSEANPVHSQNIKGINYLIEFENYKTDFLVVCKRISDLVEKVRSVDIWLPSRYSTIAINELITIEPSKLDKERIEYVIFKSVDLDIDEKIFPEWRKSILFEGREKIIEEAFVAHKSKLFAPAITCFLTQLDHVVLQIAKYLKIDKERRNANYKILEDICSFIERDISYNVPVTMFFNKNIGDQLYWFQMKSLIQYLRDVVFEDTDKRRDTQDEFNRHGILHGVFSQYPNATNSTKLILLIDDLTNLFQTKIHLVGLENPPYT